MRIGTSRADRLGFIVFTVLAALVAVLLITSLNSEDAESAQSVSTFADLPEATAVPTTAPLSVPEPTATPTPPPTAVPTAAPTPTPEPEPESSTTEGTTIDASTQNETASAGDGTSVAAPVAAAGGAVPNPQPQATAVPNPQPKATEVPNPQPKTETPTGNQPGPSGGGTFTHTLTATVQYPTLHSSFGGPAFTPAFGSTALPAQNPTVFGNPLVYRVIAGEPGDSWAQIYVPARPNGTTAWVSTSQFSWGSSNRMIQINVGNNTVTVFEGSNVLLTTGAVTGKSSTRTPIASGWVEEVIDGGRLGSAYGPVALSLGLFSNDLNSFGGSVPKIALHGTNNPGLIGQYASNGCIRVRNEIISQIRSLVPAGSRVEIVSG